MADRQGRDIIVIGASAGGVQALSNLVGQLPAGLPASIFVALHIAPDGPNELPAILTRSGPIPAHYPTNNEVFEPGHIYVAPPDLHLFLESDRIHVWRGPKENMHRPAVNVLFRSAAVAYRARVAGAILSGTMDDGSTGLWWIKHYGGVTIVQDPSDAKFPDMIYSVLEHVEIDHIVPVARMGQILVAVSGNGTPPTNQTKRKMEGARKWNPAET